MSRGYCEHGKNTVGCLTCSVARIERIADLERQLAEANKKVERLRKLILARCHSHFGVDGCPPHTFEKYGCYRPVGCELTGDELTAIAETAPGGGEGSDAG